MQMKRIISMALLTSMTLSMNAVHVRAEEEAPEEKQSGYVLMDIPYDKFYEAEGDPDVDAVSSATLNKPRTGTLAGGSYHVNADGTDISGVIYPVYVEDMAAIAQETQITDESSVTITVRNRGQETTTVYEGKDALFESASYSYYVLDEAPAYYKVLSGADGVYTFSEVKGEAQTVEGVTAEVKTGARHADVEISLSNTVGIEKGQRVNAVVLTLSDGSHVGLRHIANLWRATEIGWDADEFALGNRSITNIRYITETAVIDYPVDINLGGYVLMDIPYDKFYAAELSADDPAVDAVSSATLNKPRTGTLAGGSYHVNSDGSDITGVIYPVYVEDMTSILNETQITDESSVTITVTNRGKETTIVYEGKDALFESPSYSYYKLSEAPAYYKVMSAVDGEYTFSEVKGETKTVEGVEAEVKVGARHADVEVSLSNTAGIEKGQRVNAVVLTLSDGSHVGLRHIANLWRATEIGWDADEFALGNRSITNIRYITETAIIDYPVDINLGGYVLMDIPYDKFYAAELSADDPAVDAVSSATLNKPRTGTLAGGSYHVNSDGSDITGVIYPVYVEDMTSILNETQITDESSVEITVKNRGQETTTVYEGKDALFESPSYSYYKLSEAPAYYKVMSAVDGEYTFSEVKGETKTVEGVEAEVKVGARHTNIEISLTNTEGIEKGDRVNAVILTLSDGSHYGLRHIANLWRATEIGWNLKDFDLGERTITNIRYITENAVIDYPVEISTKVEIKAEFTDDNTITVTDVPTGLRNPKVTVTAADGTVILETAEITNEEGTVVLTLEEAALPGTYTVTITSDNCYDLSAEAVQPEKAYKIIEGADSTWVKGSKKDQLITSDAPFEKFAEVRVDDKTVAAENYTAKSGSTKITFKAAYLETLSVGAHKVTIQSADGKAETTLTIAKAETKPAGKTTPNTGDHSDTVLWTAVMIGAIAAAFIAIRSRMHKA